MPVEESISVKFKGDVSDLEKSSANVAKSFDKVDNAVAQTTKNLSSFSSVSQKVSQASQQMAKSAAVAGGSLDKVNKSQGAATQSLINLSRVAQDAPFGFIGIANNLNPLLESFQRLRAESGSNASALKVLGTSLIGPAGIGLALGVVSSLLITFGDRIFNSKSAVEKQSDAIKKAAQALRDYEESLGDIDSINLKGSQDAQAELIKLSTLYKASQDSANISLENRKKIVDQLQDQYPSYFANIKDEAFLAGGAKEAYDKLVTSIIATSRARAAAERAVEIQKDRLTVEQQLADAEGKRNAAAIKAAQERQRIADIAKRAGGGATLALDPTIGKQSLNAARELAALEKEIGVLKTKRFELDRRAAKVAAISQNLTAQQPFSTDEEKKQFEEQQRLLEESRKAQEATNKRKLSELKKHFEEEKKLFQQRQSEIRQFLAQPLETRDFQPELSDKIARDLIEIKPSDKLTTLRPKVVVIPDIQLDPNALKAALQAQLLESINSSISQTIKQIQATAFAGIGEAIAGAITGGGIGDAFNSLFTSIGSAIQELGKRMIELSPLLTALQAAIKNPALLLPAGIGLVALGAVIKNAMGNVKPFATGGLVFGPTLGLVGEGRGTTRSNPEIIAPLNKLGQFIGGGNGHMQLEAVIRGSQIKLISNREDRRQRRVR